MTSTSPNNTIAAMVREAFTHFWTVGDGLLVMVDAQHPDLIMPPDIRLLEPLVLDYNPRAIVPISDLKIEDSGISATLSFNQTNHKTFVPWDAIIGIASRNDHTQAPKPEPKRNHLKLVS